MFLLKRWFMPIVCSAMVVLTVAGVAYWAAPARLLWRSDNGDGTYRNPVLFADYSDPDAIRVGNDYYMIASSFQCTPGIPVLHSTDLVNWRIVGHVLSRLPSERYDLPRHGEGCWAPALRYHAGQFWVYFGDPDLGIYMAKTTNPAGPWEPPVLVKSAKGWIDPCPLWDDDGSMYLVHAWAKSRVGFNAVLTVNRLSPDGRQVIGDGVDVFKGGERQFTIEGPKFYKRNGYYYIFAPAGGVKTGWQVALRSRQVFGPYEDRNVLHQGSTAVNGPHQGAWVEASDGASWFLHFQDRGAYGRITHLQPMTWRDDWPVMGDDREGKGIGEPVAAWRKPHSDVPGVIQEPQTSDEFNARQLGLQWQWEANASDRWWSLAAQPGSLRLFAVPQPADSRSLWDVPNLLLQKFPAPRFTATTRVDPRALRPGEKAGLLVMGGDYAYLAIARMADGWQLVKAVTMRADKGAPEAIAKAKAVKTGPLYLRVTVEEGALCQFSYSRDGKTFSPVGENFTARQQLWNGAKVGLFSLASDGGAKSGYADFDWFRVE